MIGLLTKLILLPFKLLGLVLKILMFPFKAANMVLKLGCLISVIVVAGLVVFVVLAVT